MEQHFTFLRSVTSSLDSYMNTSFLCASWRAFELEHTWCSVLVHVPGTQVVVERRFGELCSGRLSCFPRHCGGDDFGPTGTSATADLCAQLSGRSFWLRQGWNLDFSWWVHFSPCVSDLERAFLKLESVFQWARSQVHAANFRADSTWSSSFLSDTESGEERVLRCTVEGGSERAEGCSPPPCA